MQKPVTHKTMRINKMFVCQLSWWLSVLPGAVGVPVYSLLACLADIAHH